MTTRTRHHALTWITTALLVTILSGVPVRHDHHLDGSFRECPACVIQVSVGLFALLLIAVAVPPALPVRPCLQVVFAPASRAVRHRPRDRAPPFPSS